MADRCLMTRQGVRDLGGNSGRRRSDRLLANCPHLRMREHCPGCGHYVCDDCGEFYDLAADEDPDYLSGRLWSPRLRG